MAFWKDTPVSCWNCQLGRSEGSSLPRQHHWGEASESGARLSPGNSQDKTLTSFQCAEPLRKAQERNLFPSRGGFSLRGNLSQACSVLQVRDWRGGEVTALLSSPLRRAQSRCSWDVRAPC